MSSSIFSVISFYNRCIPLHSHLKCICTGKTVFRLNHVHALGDKERTRVICKSHANVNYRCLQTSSSSKIRIKPYIEPFKRIAYKAGLILPENYSNDTLQAAAFELLNGIYMRVPHAQIREFAGLENSFNLWMHVVYLHLWCLFVRLLQEGRDGEIIMMAMTRILWFDVTERLKKIEDENSQNLKIRKRMVEYHNLLYTSFSLFDEGILGDDMQLASSLWTLVYHDNQAEAEAWQLEALLHYVRFTVSCIDEVDFNTLVLKPSELNWLIPRELQT